MNHPQRSTPLATRLRRRSLPAEPGLIQEQPSLFSELRLAILTATFEAQQDCELPPFKGSTFRGAFGHSLKAMAGHPDNGDCPLCARTRCGYGYIFTEQSSGNGRNGVLPLILQPPEDRQEHFQPGECLSLNLNLVGDAVSWIPTVVWALGRMGWKGLGKGKSPWTLIEVTAQQAAGPAISLMDSFDAVPVVTGQDIVRAWPDFDRCRLTFASPLCIRSDGRMLQQPDAVTLIRRLNGRIGDLLETFCGVAPNVFDLKTMNDAAAQIQVDAAEFRPAAWERFSTRSGRRHDMDGIIGHLQLSRIPLMLTPLLILGQYLHVGKSAAFGMGGYQLTPR